uniref:Uncharacterized protein n=1 Tax=Rhizophora mucronata TaxID=61149 RepID=A0A2P2QB93_RHIMU
MHTHLSLAMVDDFQYQPIILTELSLEGERIMVR